MTIVIWIGWLFLVFLSCYVSMWAGAFSLFASGSLFVTWKEALPFIAMAAVLWYATVRFAPFSIHMSASFS